MHDFCPLCTKKGLKRKIKAVQINLEEAVWMCEAEECVWPFGYEEFIYLPRVVGKTWSCYWNDYKPNTSNIKDFIPVSTELSMYTPPVTPCGDHSLKECNIDVPQITYVTSSNFNVDATSVKVMQAHVDNMEQTNIVSKGIMAPKAHDSLKTGAIKAVDDSASISSIHEQNIFDNNDECVVINEHCIKQPNKIFANNQNPTCDSIKQIVRCQKATSDVSNTSDPIYPKLLHCSEEKSKQGECSDPIVNTSSMKTNQKTMLKIRSIEKINVEVKLDSNYIPVGRQDKITSKMDNCLSSTAVSNSSVSNVRLPDHTETMPCNQSQAQNIQECQVKSSTTEQNMVTTVKLEGLPQITLSYDASILRTSCVPESDCSEPVKPAEPTISAQKLRSIQLSKRHTAESKKYKKFSFNAVINKMKGQQTNGTDDASNSTALSASNSDAGLTARNELEKKDPESSVQHRLKDDAKSVVSSDINSISNSGNTSRDNSVSSANISIDSFLDDFLRNDCSMSEEINDDWLNALLV